VESLRREQRIFDIAKQLNWDKEFDFQGLSSLLSGKLAQVEDLFKSMLSSEVGIISEIGEYIVQSAGKRIRPLLHLLSAGMCGYQGDRDVRFAAIFEAIHSATLIHDDIIDNAHTRRGKATINRRWGNAITVLLGDYIYTKSVLHAIQDGDLKIIQLIAQTTMDMIEGELMEEAAQGKIDLAEEDYLEIVKRKTAVLFSACCAVAAIISNASERKIIAMKNYGMNLGIAFQLADDLLDFTADEKTLGKPVASDLKEGRLTLPLIYLLELGNGKHKKLIGSILQSKENDSESFNEVLKLIKENGGIHKARQKALSYAKEAKSAIDSFKDSLYKEILLNLTDLIVFRAR
jgi:octaprenyl-diphosphate synthase